MRKDRIFSYVRGIVTDFTLSIFMKYMGLKVIFRL